MEKQLKSKGACAFFWRRMRGRGWKGVQCVFVIAQFISAGTSKHRNTVASTASLAALHTHSHLTSHLLLQSNSTYLNSLVEQQKKKSQSAIHYTETVAHEITRSNLQNALAHTHTKWGRLHSSQDLTYIKV